MNNRPPRTRPLGIISAVALSGLLLAGLTGCASDESPATAATASQEPAADVREPMRAAFVGVIDGHTIEVQPQNENGAPNGEPNVTVRLLGVAAPVGDDCGAAEATDYLERTLLPGEPLDITYDPSLKDPEDADGNTWAYAVDVAGGGKDTSWFLVMEGYAAAWHPEGQPEPERLEEYKTEEQTAASNGKGLWKTCGGVSG